MNAAALFFAAANVLAGFFHYLFQVWCANQVDVVSFGELNSWIAYYSLGFSVASFAQYSANFTAFHVKEIRRWHWVIFLLSCASFSIPWLLPVANGVMIALVGVFFGILFSWYLGQFQARAAFVIMGFATILCAVAKFALGGVGFPVTKPSLDLAWAVALSYAPGLILLVAVMIVWGKSWAPITTAERTLTHKLAAPIILAFSTVFIPQFDIIVVHQTQDPETIGQFAQISLLYKAVFFSFLIFSQWLLPHQLAKAHNLQPMMKWITQSYWSVPVLSVLLAMVAISCSFVIGPIFTPQLLEKREWIVLSCINMALLTNLFYLIQISAVKNDLIFASSVFLFVLCEGALAMFKGLTISQYLQMAVVFNGCVVLFSSLRWRKIDRQAAQLG